MSEPTRVKNILFMYHGYDALRFDPLNPGGHTSRSLSPVFDTSNVKYVESLDGRFEYPENMRFIRDPKTDWESSSINCETALSFSEGFKMSYEFGFGGEYKGFSGSFSQSQSYEIIAEQTAKTTDFIELTHCLVSEFSLTWLDFELSAQIKQAISSLPLSVKTKQDISAYHKFIDDYGTHYVTNAMLGGRGYKKYSTTANSIQHVLSEKIAVGAAAEAAFAISASVKGETEQALKWAREFSKAAEATQILWIGGKGGASFNEWSETVGDDPQCITAQFEEIHTLLRSDLVDDEFIDQKRQNLERVYYGLLNDAEGELLKCGSIKQLEKSYRAVANFGFRIHTFPGSTWLHASPDEWDRTDCFVLRAGSLDPKITTLHTNDIVNIVFSEPSKDDLTYASALVFERNALRLVKHAAVWGLGDSSDGWEFMNFRLNKLKDKARFRIVDPKLPHARMPMVPGRGYIITDEEGEFYLPEVEVTVAEDETTNAVTYHTSLSELSQSKHNAGFVWFGS